MIALPVLGVILTVAYAAGDRFSGGGLGWEKLAHDHGGPLRGHGVFYAGIILIALSYLLGGVWLAAAAAGWTVGRSAAWKFNGTSAVTPGPGLDDFTDAFVRHALPTLLLVIGAGTAALNGVSKPFYLPILVLYPLGATLLARRQDIKTKSGVDVNPQTELLRGALWGIVLTISLIVGA